MSIYEKKVNFPKKFWKNPERGIDPLFRPPQKPLIKEGYREGGPPTYGYREVYPVISPLCILRSHEPYENINISIWYNETNVISLSSKSNDMKKVFSLVMVIVLFSSCVMNRYHRPKTPHCVVGRVNLWK